MIVDLNDVRGNDVRGYTIDGEEVCKDCITDEEKNNLCADDIILISKTEDDGKMYFCDRCKKQCNKAYK